MREYTVRFWHPDRDLFAFSEQFASEPEIERRYIHRMEVLDDGTVTTLSECHGPPEVVERALGSAEKVIDVLATGSETTFYYVHFEPTEVTRQMMVNRRDTSLAVNMPLELRTDGSIVGRFIGDKGDVQDAFDLLPESVEAELVRVQSDVRGKDDVTSRLTDRQREVLRTAIDTGYYDDPRTATQADVADALDVSAATVGEHLRKIEANVLGSLNP